MTASLLSHSPNRMKPFAAQSRGLSMKISAGLLLGGTFPNAIQKSLTRWGLVKPIKPHVRRLFPKMKDYVKLSENNQHSLIFAWAITIPQSFLPNLRRVFNQGNSPHKPLFYK